MLFNAVFPLINPVFEVDKDLGAVSIRDFGQAVQMDQLHAAELSRFRPISDELIFFFLHFL